MLEKWIEDLRSLFQEPKAYEIIDGDNFSITQTANGPEINRVILPPLIQTLSVETLSGLRDAVMSKICKDAVVAVQVRDFNQVQVVSVEADRFGRRQIWVDAKCHEANPFPFGSFQMPEAFLISLNTCFLFNQQAVDLQRLASTLSSEHSVSMADDGISQVVTVKSGTVTRANVTLPNRLNLIPWRTFREATPVESEFLLRMKGSAGQLPSIALIEADGGRWRLDTIASVAKWLREELPGYTVIA